jgi:hypothetical protein
MESAAGDAPSQVGVKLVYRQYQNLDRGVQKTSIFGSPTKSMTGFVLI